MRGSNKDTDKVVSNPFTITSLSEVGAKSIKRLYEKMGYKHVSIKYDNKKEVYTNTFK